MKNIAINTLKYTGIVTLSQYIGSKKVKLAQYHNEGNYSLFNFLSDCLMGDFEVAKLNRPTKIMLLSDSEDKESSDKVSRSGFYFQTSKPEKLTTGTSGGSILYSFIIPGDKVASTDFEYIGLYANSVTELECSKYAAIAAIKTPEGLSQASALVVDWELAITNNSASPR